MFASSLAATWGDSMIAMRPAAQADAAPLRALHRLALRLLGSGHYSERQIESFLRHVPTLDPHLIEQRNYFVAEVQGEIVACGGWSAQAPGYSASIDFGPNVAPHREGVALIRGMYTHPAWSRRGLARRILRLGEAAAHVAGFRRIELDALLPAVELYRNHGYEAIGIKHGLLPDGETLQAVHMGRELLFS